MSDQTWPAGCPEPPDELTEPGKVEWRRWAPALCEGATLLPHRQRQLLGYCAAYAAWARAETTLAELDDAAPIEGRRALVEVCREQARHACELAEDVDIEPSGRMRDRAAEVSEQ